MINQPSVDVLIDRLGSNGEPVSRYCLCVVAAKRARQILDKRRRPRRVSQRNFRCVSGNCGRKNQIYKGLKARG